MRLEWTVLLALSACSGDNAGPSTQASPQGETSRRADASARYELRFAGVPVGATDLQIRRFGDGYRYRRDDRIAIRRDGQRIESRSSLVVDTDSNFSAREVSVISHVGSLFKKSVASRDAGGWIIRDDRGTLARRSGIEIAELAMLTPEAERSGEPMLLATAGFAVVELDSQSDAAGGFRVVVRSELGESSTLVGASDDGLPSHWGSDSGESAIRTRIVSPPLHPVELLSLAAMPSQGRRTSRLRVRHVTRELPPSIAGQQLVHDGDDWLIEFSTTKVAIPTQVADLVAGVDALIVDDLTAPSLSGREALRMERGDCSAHAGALAVLAREQGYQAKLATGYRRRGRSWLRHRWTLIELDGEWVSLDPSFGETRPSRSRLLVMATHEPTIDAMALADLLAFAGMSDARAEFE